MATKNLYMLEDVIATLLYAIQTSNLELAYACKDELEYSNEDAKMWKALTFAWLLHTPGRSRKTKTQAKSTYEALIQNDANGFLESLSGFELPALDACEKQPPFVPAQPTDPTTVYFPWKIYPKSWSREQAYILWRTNENALKKGYWEKAARLTSTLLPTDKNAVISLLKAMGKQMIFMAELLETTDYPPLEERIVHHAFYNALHIHASQEPKQEKKRTIPKKEGRHFHIHPEALQLWNIQPKPVSDLIGCPVLIKSEQATNYWKEICKEYQISGKKQLKFKDDESLERFYTLYFPNDIPDEWSNEERAKSHGFSIDKTNTNLWLPAFISNSNYCSDSQDKTSQNL
jgi:hypothetical protein